MISRNTKFMYLKADISASLYLCFAVSQNDGVKDRISFLEIMKQLSYRFIFIITWTFTQKDEKVLSFILIIRFFL